MSKKANPTTIGSFVVGAVVLAIAGIITFGKSEFFTEETTVVAYFDQAVTGLDVGAPVEVLGVQVGTVSGIKGVLDPATLEIKVPVYLTVEKGSLALSRELTQAEEEVPLERTMEVLIERGMRAELMQQSLVTGKLYVGFVFEPDSDPHYHGDEEFLEVPTVTGGLDELAKNIEEIDFEGLVTEAKRSLLAVTTLVESPEIGELVSNLSELAKSLNAEIEPLSTSARTLMADADTAIKGSDVPAVADSARLLLQGLDTDRAQLAAQLAAALERLNELGADYTVLHQASETLQELGAAARSIRLLADYLERHPEAMLKGKN